MPLVEKTQEILMTDALRCFTPPGLSPTMGFSHVATAGKLVFTSGQLPLDAAGQLVGKGDFAAQVEQAFANLDRALAAAGSSMKQVARLTYYGVATLSFAELSQLGAVRDRYVDTAAPPTSAFLFVPRFINPDCLFEVEAIAVLA